MAAGAVVVVGAGVTGEGGEGSSPPSHESVRMAISANATVHPRASCRAMRLLPACGSANATLQSAAVRPDECRTAERAGQFPPEARERGATHPTGPEGCGAALPDVGEEGDGDALAAFLGRAALIGGDQGVAGEQLRAVRDAALE